MDYGLTNPRDKPTEQIIKEGYYQGRKEIINADVVIFGHAHFASSYELIKKKGKNYFSIPAPGLGQIII
jgi:hypothetical protein